MSGTQLTIFDADPLTPPTDAYAQRAIYTLMRGGGWFTSRQISEICKLSDPRGNISQMTKRGYVFEKKRDVNSHGKSYKYYRLNIDESTKNVELIKEQNQCQQQA